MSTSLRLTFVSCLPLLVAAAASTGCGGRLDLGSDESSSTAGKDGGSSSGATVGGSGGGAANASDGGDPSFNGDAFSTIVSLPSSSAFARSGTLAIERFGRQACGLLTDGTISCWGASGGTQPLSGTFTAITDVVVLCGVSTSGAIVCDAGSNLTPPAGTDYVGVTTDEIGGRVCGLSSGGDVRCNASNGLDAQNIAGGQVGVATNNTTVCALSSEGLASCYQSGPASYVYTSLGALTSVELIETVNPSLPSTTNLCGLTVAGRPVCTSSSFASDSATYTEVVFEAAQDESGVTTSAAYCGIHADGTLSCFNFDGSAINGPIGTWSHVALSEGLDGSLPLVCATDTSGKVTCWLLDGATGVDAPAFIGSPSPDLVFQH